MVDRRVGDIEWMDYVLLYTKTNAWKMTIFGDSQIESCGRQKSAESIEGVRNVLKVNELNKSMEERAYHDTRELA